MSEDLIAIYHRLNEEAWNKGNLDLIDDLLSPGFVMHNPDGTESSFADYKQAAVYFRENWPDAKWTTEHIIAQGDNMAAHWTVRATHTKPVPGLDLEPTGKEVAISGMAFYRGEGGRIAELWVINDMLGWYQQLGVTPPMD